jgi:hypothetical protein
LSLLFTARLLFLLVLVLAFAALALASRRHPD